MSDEKARSIARIDLIADVVRQVKGLADQARTEPERAELTLYNTFDLVEEIVKHLQKEARRP